MAVIEPVRGKKERCIPAAGLLLVNPIESRACRERLLAGGARRQYLFNSELVVDEHRDFFVAGPAIGAPAAVMVLEKLIALGAKKLVLCGWCGAISPELAVGDVLVPDSARIGEGTSQYYDRRQETAPSQKFSDSIGNVLREKGLPVFRGRVWSTDALFREEREVLLSLSEEHDVVAVDMEFSALCSAAAFRHIDFAASLIVSDRTLDEPWRLGVHQKCFRENRDCALDILLRSVAQIAE